MCGIVYAKDFRKGRKGVNFKIIELYKKQRGRGKNGFGYYIPEKDRFVHNTDEQRIIRLLSREHGAKEVLFHHRMPTSTNNIHRSAHPFSTRPMTGKLFKHTYIGVHNGVLNNEYRLKLDHYERGIRYVSEHMNGNITKFNDSEALIYELALFFEGLKPTMEAAGSMAWIVMELDEKGQAVKLHFGRNNGNPLKIHRKHNKFLTLSSEGPGVLITSDVHYVMDYKTGEYAKEDMTMAYSISNYRAGRKWNAVTKQYEDEVETKEVGFTSGGDKVHSYPLATPPAINMAFSGHRYANGHYDDKGVWHPTQPVVLAETPALDAAGFVKDSFFTPTQRREYANAVPSQSIEKFVSTILAAAEYESDTAKKVVANKLKKAKELATVQQMKMEGQGPLFLDTRDFNDLDEKLWAAEADVYIYEEAFARINKLTDNELADMWMSEQSERAEIDQRTKVGR